MMTNGILILALGHPNYGKMAFTLAVSIKHCNPNMPIALVYTESAITHLKPYPLERYFDHMIEAPVESYYHNGSEAFIKAKTRVYDFTPFDKTIVLDADQIWLPNNDPQKLFDELEVIDFTIQNRSDSYSWASPIEIRSAYNLPESASYIAASSEVICFTRNNVNEDLFNFVKQNYDSLKVKHKEFAGAIPDELCFTIAMMQCGIYPHKKPWVKSYWRGAERRNPIGLNEIGQVYYLLSLGGKAIHENVRQLYNKLAAFYFQKAGLQYPYKAQHKRRFLRERQKL